jgi:Leucine rich repeat
LDLHSCQIAKIDATVFSNLDLLETLDLKKNLLENLPHNIFSHMKNLKTLFLEENPWNCDCRLKKFKHWYSTMTFKPLKCETGRFKGQFWHNVDTFGCAPELELYEDEYTSDDIGPNWIIGSNISVRILTLIAC